MRDTFSQPLRYGSISGQSRAVIILENVWLSQLVKSFNHSLEGSFALAQKAIKEELYSSHLCLAFMQCYFKFPFFVMIIILNHNPNYFFNDALLKGGDTVLRLWR